MSLKSRFVEELCKSRGLQCSGFHQALRRLACDVVGQDADDDSDIDDEFGEQFGDWQERPAAFSIAKDPDGWTQIHAYEICISVPRPSPDKMAAYGRIADGDGPRVTLHIIDSMGQETILSNDVLMLFYYVSVYGEEHCWEQARQYATRGEMLSLAPESD